VVAPATKGGEPSGPKFKGFKGFKGFRRFKGFRGGGIALRAMRFYILLREMKTKQPPFGRKKQANRASPVGNAPLSPPTAVLPPEGEVLAPL